MRFLTPFLAITALIAASPALAGGATTVPDPSDITLFAISLAGVIVGRRFAKRPPRK